MPILLFLFFCALLGQSSSLPSVAVPSSQSNFQGEALVDFGAAVAVADVNLDGALDIAASDPKADAGAVYILFCATAFNGGVRPWVKSFRKLSASSEDFLTSGLVGSSLFGSALSFGDVNGDGIVDMAASAPGQDLIFILFLGKTGLVKSFTSTTQFTAPKQVCICADLNSDGIRDMVGQIF